MSSSWKVDRTCGRFQDQRMGGGDDYTEGHAATPWGYVVAWSCEGHTALRFIHNGREHSRVLDKQLTRRGLAIACGRFAREIAEGGGDDA